MSAVRKRESFNQRVNEMHERKVEKEEQQRLERMQRTNKQHKRSWKPMYSGNLMEMDFSALELRVAAHFSKEASEALNI